VRPPDHSVSLNKSKCDILLYLKINTLRIDSESFGDEREEEALFYGPLDDWILVLALKTLSK
jgi:hypothetical protein